MHNYLEIDIDIGSSTIAIAILRLALGCITAVTSVDEDFLVQAQSDEELLERLFGAFSNHHRNFPPGFEVCYDNDGGHGFIGGGTVGEEITRELIIGEHVSHITRIKFTHLKLRTSSV
ncbi:protein of unknown function-containing protein [Forsythia ovata]|uniref:Protein ENHANCED DISEASE RESISTANCE 2 C-terminal domain-containing protein n=1 Tax=Forsythia ovata TaxID=205694 RepID=A0ABD1SU15_9LAMI